MVPGAACAIVLTSTVRVAAGYENSTHNLSRKQARFLGHRHYCIANCCIFC